MSIPINLNDDLFEWQDDAEVTSCFICDRPYNIFFNRRHHCRKCGKVVCGDCSSQFISYFPNTPIVTEPHVVFPQYSKPHTKYRTCDQCVEEILMIRRALFNSDTRSHTTTIASSVETDHEDNNNGAVSGGGGGGGGDDVHGDIHSDGNNDGGDNNSLTKHVSHQYTRHLHNSTPSLRATHDLSSDSNLCPVCATNLLKLYIADIHSHAQDKTYLQKISNEDYEKFKEFHINQCLTNFDFDTNHSNRFSPDNLKTLKNKMLVYNIPPIPKPMYENIESGSNSLPIEKANKLEEIKGDAYDEEDDDDEEEEEEDNECVICLESLNPGDKVGRLECLCVFHYKCIKDWFNKKGYGECPVHFLHK